MDLAVKTRAKPKAGPHDRVSLNVPCLCNEFILRITNHVIPMRDGSLLRGDLYVPVPSHIFVAVIAQVYMLREGAAPPPAASTAHSHTHHTTAHPHTHSHTHHAPAPHAAPADIPEPALITNSGSLTPLSQVFHALPSSLLAVAHAVEDKLHLDDKAAHDHKHGARAHRPPAVDPDVFARQLHQVFSATLSQPLSSFLPRVVSVAALDGTLPPLLEEHFRHTPSAARGGSTSRFTVMLVRTPYNKAAGKNVKLCLFYACSGFAAYIQDVRGRFASAPGNRFYKYVHESNDGFDTVQRLAALSLCAGKVVGNGKSYLAHTQVGVYVGEPHYRLPPEDDPAALPQSEVFGNLGDAPEQEAPATGPPATGLSGTGLSHASRAGWRGGFLNMGGFFNAYTSGIRQGGAFEARQLVWAWKKATAPNVAFKDAIQRSQDLVSWLKRGFPMKATQSFLRHAPDYDRFIAEQMQQTRFGPFWLQKGLNTEAYMPLYDVNSPTLLFSGWYDIYTRATVELHHAIDRQVSLKAKQQAKQLPGAGAGAGAALSSPPLYRPLLVLGPWGHTSGTDNSSVGEVYFGKGSRVAAVWQQHSYSTVDPVEAYGAGHPLLDILPPGAQCRLAIGRDPHRVLCTRTRALPAPDLLLPALAAPADHEGPAHAAPVAVPPPALLGAAPARPITCGCDVLEARRGPAHEAELALPCIWCARARPPPGKAKPAVVGCAARYLTVYAAMRQVLGLDEDEDGDSEQPTGPDHEHDDAPAPAPAPPCSPRVLLPYLLLAQPAFSPPAIPASTHHHAFALLWLSICTPRRTLRLPPCPHSPPLPPTLARDTLPLTPSRSLLHRVCSLLHVPLNEGLHALALCNRLHRSMLQELLASPAASPASLYASGPLASLTSPVPVAPVIAPFAFMGNGDLNGDHAEGADTNAATPTAAPDAAPSTPASASASASAAPAPPCSPAVELWQPPRVSYFRMGGCFDFNERILLGTHQHLAEHQHAPQHPPLACHYAPLRLHSHSHSVPVVVDADRYVPVRYIPHSILQRLHAQYRKAHAAADAEDDDEEVARAVASIEREDRRQRGAPVDWQAMLARYMGVPAASPAPAPPAPAPRAPALRPRPTSACYRLPMLAPRHTAAPAPPRARPAAAPAAPAADAAHTGLLVHGGRWLYANTFPPARTRYSLCRLARERLLLPEGLVHTHRHGCCLPPHPSALDAPAAPPGHCLAGSGPYDTRVDADMIHCPLCDAHDAHRASAARRRPAPAPARASAPELALPPLTAADVTPVLTALVRAFAPRPAPTALLSLLGITPAPAPPAPAAAPALPLAPRPAWQLLPHGLPHGLDAAPARGHSLGLGHPAAPSLLLNGAQVDMQALAAALAPYFNGTASTAKPAAAPVPALTFSPAPPQPSAASAEDALALASWFVADPLAPVPSVGGNVFPHSTLQAALPSLPGSSAERSTDAQGAVSVTVGDLTISQPPTEVHVLLEGPFDQVERPDHFLSRQAGGRIDAYRSVSNDRRREVDEAPARAPPAAGAGLRVGGSSVAASGADENGDAAKQPAQPAQPAAPAPALRPAPTAATAPPQKSSAAARPAPAPSAAAPSAPREIAAGSGVPALPPPGLPLAARRDVLAFESAALVNNVEVTGSVWLTLYVVSDRYDTDFAAQLVDVYPPSADYPSGFAMNIADGIVRARHRFGYSYQGLAAATNRMEQPLPPGARVAPQPGADFDAADPNAPRLLRPGWVHLLAIELFPTANLFTAGHRVRVTVSSSNYPHFDVNPNTPEGGGGQRALEATNAVLHSDLWPSAVWLPVAGCGRCKSDIDLYVTACCPGCEEQRSRQRAQSKL